MPDPWVAFASQRLESAVAQMERALERTPDERLCQSPGPDARTPLMVVAHAGESLGHILRMLQGTPYPVPTMAEADRGFMERDFAAESREEVLDRLHSNATQTLAFLAALDPARLDDPVALPFGLGEIPMRAAIFAPGDHTMSHTAQIEYLQTVYGDREW